MKEGSSKKKTSIDWKGVWAAVGLLFVASCLYSYTHDTFATLGVLIFAVIVMAARKKYNELFVLICLFSSIFFYIIGAAHIAIVIVCILLIQQFIRTINRKFNYDEVFPYFGILTILIGFYSGIYAKYGMLENGKLIYDQPSATYFSIVTWTTLGYGDIQPSEESRGWAASEALLGYIFMALGIALFAHVVNSRQHLRSEMGAMKISENEAPASQSHNNGDRNDTR